MKIIGITRVRNEEAIIKNTLDHVAGLVDGVVVFDDASTDKTPEICKNHKAVIAVFENDRWDHTPEERNRAEGELRHAAYKYAWSVSPDWVYCFDADEYADFHGIDFKADAYRLRLFDFYITPQDYDDYYLNRKFMGAEYRDILMLFRPDKMIRFHQREPNLPAHYIVENAGFVKHYGKAVSIEEWERSCDYYINHRGGQFLPKFTDKWKARQGRAIHTRSDFGGDLITWEDRFEKGTPLVD